MPKQDKVKINVKDRLEDNAIDLSLSELTEVPVKDIGALKRATVLDLSNNKLISLGKNFTSLTHITKLDLSKNQIRYLPEDFGSLKSLRHLDLFNNRLEHLPLSFGNLANLKYLDLKSNPLTPALAKIVGPCLTSKDCIESAKNTVRFLARMQKEVELAKEKLQQETEAQIDEIEEVTKKETQKAKKSKKKNKNKRKSDSTSEKGGRTRENGNAANYLNGDSDGNMKKSNSVLKTIATFTFLLVLNILMLYIITVKHPEIADKLVAMIPPRYQELIVTKSEDLRLNFLQISDWLQKFLTPPS